MQKMWAITAITLVGFMMIISSIPQDAFAGKDTVKLTLKIDPSFEIVLSKLGEESCTAVPDVGSPVTENIQIKGKNAKVVFSFEGASNVDVDCTGNDTDVPVHYQLDKKNNRATFVYNIGLNF